MADTPTPTTTAQGRYEQLATLRNPALRRAQECSALTIPSLIPPDGTTDSSILPTPYQSVGSRGVNTLGSKLMLALFPPGSAFFKLTVDEFLLDQLKTKAKAAGATDPQAAIDTALSKAERAVMTRFEQKNARPILSEYLKHLLIAGNGLLCILKDGAFKFFPLPQYVVKRDTSGEAIEIIARQGLSRRSLPPEVRPIVEGKEAPETNAKDATDTIDLYTWIQRQDDGSWTVHQEVVGQKIPGTEGTYPKDGLPWLAGRWTVVSGNDYGRGFCEEYLGDLYSMEQMAASIVQFSANAARLLWLVNEGSITRRKTIAEAPNGAVIEGDIKDVHALMMEKFNDFQVTKAAADDVKQRLEQAFLLNSSIQRNAERVTAEEIRVMASELEQTLGGNYSTLSKELQLPLVNRIILSLTREGKFPALPRGVINPEIITGLDGLGRTTDIQKLDLLFQGAEQIFGPQAVAQYGNVGAYLKRRAAALAVDIEGVIRSDQEVQQMVAAQQQAAMEARIGPQLVKATSDHASMQDAASQQPQQ